MEWNREEAEKARDKAEEKFKSDDLEGAKRFALKAQSLFPSLPGLQQFLAAYEVHIGATKKKSGRVDWHAVLGVEPSADVKTIKKKFKKLRLLTHPDKNRSKAADGAFKLVVQAWEAISSKAGSQGAGHEESSEGPNASAGGQQGGSSSSAKPDHKSSSGAMVACTRCGRQCKFLDLSCSVFRCRHCNLVGVRGKDDTTVGITIEDSGIGVHGASNMSINIQSAEDVIITGGGSIYINRCDDVSITGGDSIHINHCDGFSIQGRREVSFS